MEVEGTGGVGGGRCRWCGGWKAPVAAGWKAPVAAGVEGGGGGGGKDLLRMSMSMVLSCGSSPPDSVNKQAYLPE